MVGHEDALRGKVLWIIGNVRPRRAVFEDVVVVPVDVVVLVEVSGRGEFPGVLVGWIGPFGSLSAEQDDAVSASVVGDAGLPSAHRARNL